MSFSYLLRKIKLPLETAQKVWLCLGVSAVCLLLVSVPLFTGCGNETTASPDYEMMAAEFLDEFNENSVEFEKTYQGKRISIIGQILIIGEVDKVPILDIGSGFEDLYSIYAFFESNSSKLNNLTEGQYVRVIGVYTGQGFYSLQLHNCDLLE